MSECQSKTCLVCKETKESSEFNSDRTRKDGKHPWCRSCVKDYKELYYSKNSERLLVTSKRNRDANIDKIRDYDRERGKSPKRRRRGTDKWKGKAVNIISSMRSNSKRRNHAWDESWWTVEKVLSEIENKVCPETGVPFLLNVVDTRLYKTNPCTPSADRVDNTRGYEPDNVRFVSWFYNNLKRDHTQDEVQVLLDVMTHHRMTKLLSEEETAED